MVPCLGGFLPLQLLWVAWVAEAKALAQAAAAALPRRTASSGPGEGPSGLEEANGRLLSRDDILARVPVGQPAFEKLRNQE